MACSPPAKAFRVAKTYCDSFLNCITFVQQYLGNCLRSYRPNISGNAQLNRVLRSTAPYPTNLRDAQWEPEEIALVLGESVADTARHYALGRRAASKSPRTSEVVRGTTSGARKVRPVDRSGLNAVQSPGRR